MRSEGVGTGELQPPALMFPHVFEKTNLPDPPPPALLSTSTPTSLVFSPSQSIRLTPPSQPPPILVHRRSYAFVTFCCARVPCPRVSHSSGVTGVRSVLYTAYNTSKFVMAFIFDPFFCGPMVKRGPEPVTTTGQGNLWERSTRREVDGVGGSVAGWESVCDGIAE